MTKTNFATTKPNAPTIMENSQPQEPKNSPTQTFDDMLRETQQAEFPLLGEVIQGFVSDPLSLMNAHFDGEGVVVPCALPDSMIQHLPEMMSETLPSG